MAQSLSQTDPFREIREDLASMRDEVMQLSPAGEDSSEVQDRLKLVEKAQSNLKTLLEEIGSEAPEDAGSKQQILLIKSEVQALRSEVRHLLEQSISLDDAAETPAPDEDQMKKIEKRIQRSIKSIEKRMLETSNALAPVESNLQGLEEKLENVQQQVSLATQEETKPEDQELQKQMVNQLEDKIKNVTEQVNVVPDLEEKMQQMEQQISSLDQKNNSLQHISNEIDHLKDGYNLFIEEIRSLVKNQQIQSEERTRELSEQKKAMDEIQAVFQKIHSAFS